MKVGKFFLFIGVSALFLFSCAAQLRVKNSSSQSLAELGYSKFEMVMGSSRWNALDLKNGSATEYKNMPDDGLGSVSLTYVEVYTFPNALSTSSNVYDFRSHSTFKSQLSGGFKPGFRYTYDINGPQFSQDN